jgi:two-component system cell cycle sensor histidine kinase/response regulator CckA
MLETVVDFAALFEADLDACVLIDAQQTVLRTNKAFEKLFGYSSDEAVGRNIDELIVPGDRRGEAINFREQARAQGGLGLETVRCRRDGELIDVSVVALPINQAGGDLMVYVQYRDISRQKRAEDALRASESQLRALFEHAPVGIAVVDLQGSITHANPFLCEMLGYQNGELDGRHVHDISHPDENAAVDKLRAELNQGWRDMIDLEKRYRRRDGSYVWGHLNSSMIRSATGAPLYVVGIIEDISAKREAAERRERALALFESLIQNMRDGVLVESADRRVAAVNPAFLAAFGIKASPTDLLGVDCREAARQAAGLMENGSEFVETIERRIGEAQSGRDQVRFLDGRCYERDYVPIRDGQGRVTGHMWDYKDLTDLLALQDQLRQSQKMEAVGRLAGGIAHDFNNLLTVLQGHAAMLLEEPLSPTVQGDVHEILKASNKAANLTRQLLAYSRQQVLKPVTLKLGDVVTDLERTLLRMIGEDVRLIVEASPDTPLVRADRTQIEQVILNLAVNARDAMPGGGRLRLRALPCRLEAPLPARDASVPPGSYARLSISDSGDGIDEAILNRIFDPFFTTKEQGKGTGLGLSTVYGIIKQSGGYITVESRRGAGATFTIYLPEVPAS